MWILPRQLISAFAPVMGASTLDCDAASQACAQLLMRRSKRSQSSSYFREWKAGNLMRLQSGLICDHSRGRAFETAWTSSLAVIPVSHSAQPVSDSEQTTSATSGQLSQLAFGFCDQESASSRTSRDTSALGYGKSSMSWEQWVTERRGEYSARLKSARLTNASECSSWPTVCANEDSYRIGGDSQQSKCLSAMARRGEMGWPSPSSRDHKGAPASRCTPEGYNARLDEAVILHGRAAPAIPSSDGSHPESWPTPASSTGQGGAHGLGGGSGANATLKTIGMAEMGTGKLNPRWVETLMGLPVGWTMPSCACPVTIAPTSCDSSATESSQPPQNELFGS